MLGAALVRVTIKKIDDAPTACRQRKPENLRLINSTKDVTIQPRTWKEAANQLAIISNERFTLPVS
jgi:hypothetical protein